MDNLGTRLLLVDDNAKLCRMVKQYLEPLGYDVAVAHTGQSVPSGTQHYQDGDIAGIKQFKGDDFILGGFEPEKATQSSDRYVMIVNKRHGSEEHDADLKATAAFTPTDEFSVVYRYDPQTGQPVQVTANGGVYSLPLDGGCCALVRLARQPIPAAAGAAH